MQKKRHTSSFSFRGFFLKGALFCGLAFFSAFSVSAQCDNVDGGSVTFTNGDTETTTIADGMADMLSFMTDVDAAGNNHDFTYVVTDGAGGILGIPPGNMVDFDPAGVGVCRVYGLSYTGNLNIAMGDDLFSGEPLSDDCFDLSANHLKVNRVAPQATENTLVASSGTSGFIGVFSILADGSVLQEEEVETPATDADGIAYDVAGDKLYQLSRNFDRVYEFSDFSTNPTLTATSGANEFTNGREIAVVGSKIVVAQDANASNGDQNRFYIYDINNGSLDLEKIYDADINLWGIHANGNQFFAVQDNSNNVAVYEDFFNQPAGAIVPTALVSIENLVRTHGITYDPENDAMYLTDVGEASSPTDGAIVVVNNWTAASADGMVTADEQIRVDGPASLLGNPVDIAIDKANNRVYVAERANGGGRILGFKTPAATGSIAPAYKRLFPAAAAVFISGVEAEIDLCSFVDGGTVALPDGNTEITTINDGEADELSFTSSIDPVAAGHSFTYVVTDDAGMVLGVPPGNMVDFDPAGVGACAVYGLSYTGTLMVAMGDDLFGGQPLSDDCFDLSDNSIVVTRVDPTPVEAQLFASSNTSGNVGVFNILDDGNIFATTFAANGEDSDGIYFDETADVLYQLDRTNNVIVAYSDVNATLLMGGTPAVTATSSAGDFMNGREIAVSGSKLVVADDGDNNFVVYDISPTSITLDKVLNADINLWGIQFNGDQLIAIEDNSANVAVYDDFLNQPAGAIAATASISIEGMVRTHGLTYDVEDDYMLLTDVGDAMSATDGALFAISNWSGASADGMVTADELVRVNGPASFLGNPVDVAYDKGNNRVYVAERANGGGRILGFKMPAVTSSISPAYNNLFAGASAVNIFTPAAPIDPCDFVDGGTVALPDGNTEITTINDGVADELSFTSSIDPMTAGYSFTYVVTDDAGMVLGVPPGNMVDFDPAGVGACAVYGLAYTGTLSVAMGDDLFGGQPLSDDCFDLSDNSIIVNRVDPSDNTGQLFASSNTQGMVGVFNLLENGEILKEAFAANGMDADGIHYDQDADVIYQLDRTNNVIVAYSDVNASLAAGNMPMITATSSADDFMNGREIAVSGSKLVVADDTDNNFVVYDISPTSITLDKVLNADINLWGIQFNGDQLIAIEDNSANVAVYDDFLNQPAGAIAVSASISIEGMVRTHGLTYDAEEDYMLLTDVGEASSATDGALFAVSNWSGASSDGMVTADELVRVNGPVSFLGNPVDVAYDKANNRVYIAERANGGGRILGFKKPAVTSSISPAYNTLFAGASAVNFAMAPAPVDPCAFVMGGTVTLTDGNTEVTTINDGVADELSFMSSIDPVAAGHSFTYVVTDDAGMVLGVPPGNTVDFDPAGVGACAVYGLSYTGTLMVAMGDDLFGGQPLSDDCFSLSDNSIVVTRIDPQPVDATVYVSSNNQTRIGTYNVLEDGTVVAGSFDAGAAMDSDGIHYDKDNDVLYQVNRTDNVVTLYTMVSTNPTVAAVSSSDFGNGRGIAVSGGKLVVADDTDNNFVIYDVTPTSITFDKIYNADINLWGVHIDGDRMIAIADNTGDVAIYDDFFNQPAGAISPTATVTIEGLVRTHGLDYDAADDMLILTDVGEASSDNDGALIVVRDFAVAGADGMVDASEQARAEGGASFLGNPVDVALDKQNKRIYVAERARDGGRLLGFNTPLLTGGIAPFFNTLYAGASSVFIPEGDCDFLTGGAVTFDDGTTVKDVTVNDGMADVLTFVTDVDAAAGGYSQTFVVTDGAPGNILGIPGGNSVDFETSGVGECRVYNVSYTGNFMLQVGGNLFFDDISDECGVVSSNFLLTNRTENLVGNGNGGINGTAANSIAQVYPTPVSNTLNVVIDSEVEQRSIIYIFNAAGNRVSQENVGLYIGQNRLTIDVASFENGMYFLQLPGSNEMTKFVKMRN